MPANLDKDAGFTLMEVLAALLIFSVSTLGLVASVNSSVRLGTEVELKTYGGIVAENAVAVLQADYVREGGALRLPGGSTSAPDTVDYAGLEFTTTHSFAPLEGASLVQHRVEVTHEDRVVATRVFFTQATGLNR